MNKEALQKVFFLLSRSKVLFPCLLLLIAWIITIFTFCVYQTPKTSVEGIAMKKFSNLSPSPIVTPTATVSIEKGKENSSKFSFK
jgi:hypothetical protein